MANKSKEEVMMENKILRQILFPCDTCKGRGKIDDAEPGDICFKEWPCPACKGFDAHAAKKLLEKSYSGT